MENRYIFYIFAQKLSKLWRATTEYLFYLKSIIMKNCVNLLLFLGVGLFMSSCNCAQTGSTEQQTVVDESEIVVNNILSRRSIRKYQETAVPREMLDKIIECGINAPNGMNQQCYQVKVVDDAASVAYLADNLKGLYKAPVYMFIAAQDNYDMSRIDCGLLSENICLSAWSMGIGSINLGMPVRALKDNPEILAKLGFDEHYELCLVLALGYPAESPDAKPRKADKVQFITITE